MKHLWVNKEDLTLKLSIIYKGNYLSSMHVSLKSSTVKPWVVYLFLSTCAKGLGSNHTNVFK